ncbi:Nucleoside-diphosphate-sugar epimerase [Ectothiorhodosinus mongolicus]|uniref:Nucleoside-diphosphate-sugar epimerase n=1 Tax=Ectothiorhodosinus mongolicus TaxID=233100 RepID=A0A1R3W115_9GAMM|nr:Nucleoside-diphosphate-sugar epimerase [Ectothiorhodosinus mongolicus]
MAYVKPVLIIGCGYVGKRVARRLLAKGRQVTAAVRSEERVSELESDGITTRQIDLDSGQGLDQLPLSGAQILHSAPPPATGETDPRTDRLLSVCRKHPPANIVYISTTGVYGDRGGDSVDELTEPAPLSDRGKRRRYAELALLAFMQETGVPVTIIRAPGIYGPGRLPIARINAAEPVVNEQEAGPGNRIHADDLASICVAAMEHGPAGRIYNAGDGDHRSMTAFVMTTAELAGLPKPPEISLAEAEKRLSPGMMSFIRESRVVRADRVLVELDLNLRYPRMEQGIQASLAEQADHK